MKQDWEPLIPLLVHIQANLDQDLGLAVLSQRAGLSTFHLQRLFKAVIGETPKAYTSRLRVERAAFRLLIHESSLLDIALECGFQSHETFIRAFRRRFGKSPRDYRKWMQGEVASSNEHVQGLPDAAQAFEISATKVIPLRPMHLAFRRHVGPYESVPESIFDELEQWAAARPGRQLPGPPVWMGIGQDAPVTTPPEQLRFDAALVAIRARRSDRVPVPGRRPFRCHDPCRILRDTAGCLRRDLPAGHGSCRLPVRRSAGGGDLPHGQSERALSAEPHRYLPSRRARSLSLTAQARTLPFSARGSDAQTLSLPAQRERLRFQRAALALRPCR